MCGMFTIIVIECIHVCYLANDLKKWWSCMYINQQKHDGEFHLCNILFILFSFKLTFLFNSVSG